MIIWRRKTGPLLRWSRLVHLIVGAGIPLLCSAAWGYPGLGWGCVGSMVAGVLWEIGTIRLWLWLGTSHPWADVLDLGAWWVGTVAVALMMG